MELKDRIQNIKNLLNYCPVSSDEVMIYDDKCQKFFAKFFSSYPGRFEKPEFDNQCVVQIGLYDIFDANLKTKHNTISIKYCYEYDRSEGEDWTFYLFNDPECYFDRFMERPDIEYSEIPDYIWKIIQEELYKKATESVNNDLESAFKRLDTCTKRFEKFTKELKEKLIEE